MSSAAAYADVLYTARHCIMGSSVFLIYDYVITFGREVDLFWTTKLTGASVLFFTNRYVTLLFNALGLVALGHFSDTKSCSLYFRSLGGISYFQYIIWAAFSCLRAFALSRNRLLAAFVGVLMLAPAGINYGAQFVSGLSGVNDPLLGCLSTSSMPRVLARQLVIASRVCIITGDLILVVITWATLASRHPVADMASRRTRWTLSSVLLRDGVMYFLIMLLLNVLHLAFTQSAVFGRLLSNISLFSNEVVGVLVSRFLIDLQAASQRTLKLDPDDPLHPSTTWTQPSQSATLSFARVVGSLSATLDGRETYDSDVEWDDTDARTERDVEMDGSRGGVRLEERSGTITDGSC